MKAKYDAHVKARRALALKVVKRRREWSASHLNAKMKTLFGKSVWEITDEDMLPYAYAAISSFSTPRGQRDRSSWREGWGNKYGAYSPFSGAALLGQTKEVPAHVVHQIMCLMFDYD